jgi:hypothetical protein
MPGSEICMFGMTLLERLLRGLQQTAAALNEVRVELAAGAPIPDSLPEKLVAALPLRWSRDDLPLAQRFERAMREAEGDPVLALAADTAVDTRVIGHLCEATGSYAFIHGDGEERGALLRVESELPESAEGDTSLLLIAERAIRIGAAKEFAESDFSGYIAMLRRHLAPYLFRIPDGDSRNRVERFLFWSNYKGSTDFMTKYVYPPLVWTFVHPLARWRVHPNWVTGFDWLATFATVPLFAAGAWVPGLLLAYLMSVFDSVDGKLARLLAHGLGVVARRRRRRVGALSGVAVAAGILRPGPGVRGRLQGPHGRIDPRVHPARREGADLHLPTKRQSGPVHGRVDGRLDRAGT